MSVERANFIISRIGTEQLMFATDYPTVTVESELERFNALSFTPREKEDVFFGNAMRFLGLD